MKTAFFTLPFAAALALLPLEAGAAEPPAPSAQAASDLIGTVHVELRMESLAPELAEEIRALLPTELERRAAELGLAVEESMAADLILEINLAAPQPVVTAIASRATIGKAVVAEGDIESCIRCGAPQLLDLALGGLPQAAAVLREQVEAERAAERERLEAEAAAAEPVDTAPTQGDRMRLGVLGYVGVGFVAVGVGASIGGGIFLARGQVVDEGTGLYVNATDYRPAGWALLGAGIGASVIGTVMTAVDLGVLAPRRASRRRGKITGLGPMLGDGVGVGVSGKF